MQTLSVFQLKPGWYLKLVFFFCYSQKKKTLIYSSSIPKPKKNKKKSLACSTPPGYANFYGDCDDSKATVNPLVNEILHNSIDDDCDGITDEGYFEPFFFLVVSYPLII